MTGSADARTSARRQDEGRHASGWWRADVQGLRAVAVLGVVTFHAGLPVRGGFAGVDVFFVISGFVIGGLLLRELRATNRFSPSTFYVRRARRILPAAALMTVTVVAASTVLLSPLGNVQQSAGQAASAASVFLANAYFFLFTGGYFPQQTTANPFLYTWSLSVEEQFYFVLPWLLVLGWYLARISRRGTLTIIIVVAWIASVAANLMFTYHAIPASFPVFGSWFSGNPDLAASFVFYSPITRSWEFLTGRARGPRTRVGPHAAGFGPEPGPARAHGATRDVCPAHGGSPVPGRAGTAAGGVTAALLLAGAGQHQPMVSGSCPRGRSCGSATSRTAGTCGTGR